MKTMRIGGGSTTLIKIIETTITFQRKERGIQKLEI